MAPPGASIEPMDGIIAEDDPTNQITLLDLDQDGNRYFDMHHAWNDHFERRQTEAEPLPIDPSLYTTTGPSAPTTLDRTVVTVPEEFAEISSKILIYFAKILEIPETSEETVFTAEELEILEPIAEEVELSVPSIIGGVCVNKEPQPMEIKEIIDIRRIGPRRQTFYLAITTEGDYYWFHIPRAERDKQLRQLIKDYRHESYAEVEERKARGAKKLRSGKNC